MGESDYNYTTALSHAVLAGTSIYCLMQHPYDVGTVCFGLIATNSILGLWRWGNPEAGSTSRKCYEITSRLQEVLALGATAACLWPKSNILPSLWSIQLAVPAIPVILQYFDQDYLGFEPTIILFNGLSIIYVSLFTSNWWGVAAAASFLWGYCYVKDRGSIRDIPAIDLINYELCFFSYFALKALQGQ